MLLGALQGSLFDKLVFSVFVFIPLCLQEVNIIGDKAVVLYASVRYTYAFLFLCGHRVKTPIFAYFYSVISRHRSNGKLKP
jgi:hypothetical protein